MTGSDLSVGAVAAVNVIEINFTIAVTMDSLARSGGGRYGAMPVSLRLWICDSRRCRYRYPTLYSDPFVMQKVAGSATFSIE